MAKVYIVDGDASVCAEIEEALGGVGHAVVSESSGLVAIASLEEEAPDLVLCDLVLPDIEGFRVCSHVKTHPRLAEIPVVMLSTVDDVTVQSQAATVGAETVLCKPLRREALVALAASLLGDEAAAKDSAIYAVPPDPRTAALVRLLTTLVEQLGNPQALRFGGIVDGDGKVLHSIGLQPRWQGGSATEVQRLIHQAAAVSAQMRLGKLSGVILESESGVLLLRRLASGDCLVLSLSDVTSLGKARHLLRRLESLDPQT